MVRHTGGLADTVFDVDETPHGTGFVFHESRPASLLDAMDRAIAAWTDVDRYRALQRRGMAEDFSWSRAAHEYMVVYRDLV